MASLPRELTTREDDRHGSELGTLSGNWRQTIKA
jgi:hypothetical protein